MCRVGAFLMREGASRWAICNSGMPSPYLHSDAETVVNAIVRAAGPTIVLGLPLGLGKANTIANALYRRVARDPTLRLRIFTALTLDVPRAGNELERRLLAPVEEQTMGGYPPLEYARALRARSLPTNIEVNEFFFLAGRWLSVPQAQQDYISANYTHAARYLIDRGVNVVAQLVAKRDTADGVRLSLSCNTDITLDLLEARREGRASFLLLGEVNSELPFMTGEADRAAAEFDHLLEDPAHDFALFGPPKEPVGIREHAIGLHVARLVSDGGTLQIGIGQEADATVHGLILRHKENAQFRSAVSRLTGDAPPHPLEERQPFQQGLYGLSEMLVDGFLELMKAGILRREVDGAVLHAAFFLGTHAFYRALREMPEHELARVRMSAVSFTNELYGDESAKRRARVRARFVNNAMIATLLGNVVSDGLEDGRVVSGVGGQYNFVAQAFALPDARSILVLKSTRGTGRGERSNIRWRYAHATVPRHLRDIVVSEYGVADLRGGSDEAVIKAMLAIADSRFQAELMREAQEAGKLARTYEIPSAFRENHPERISIALRPLSESGLLPAFPFGTDFDAIEQTLVAALEPLKATSTARLLGMAAAGMLRGGATPRESLALGRMGLDRPSSLKEHFLRALVLGALNT
jgi:acyl-CoA hydrolase